MNRIMNAILFCALTMNMFAIAQDDFKHKAKITWKKITRFAERNKGKIIAGGIAALAAGLGVGAVAFVNQRANKAIENAGFDLNSIQAIKLKRFMMTIGISKTVGIAHLAKREKPVMGKNLQALAHYWGMREKDLSEEIAKKKLASKKWWDQPSVQPTEEL